MASRGKRAAPRKRPAFRPVVLLLTVGVTLGVIAWGYLVKAAIDFGVEARSGESGAWLFLAMAALGAVACLFIGLMLVARLLRELGITSGRSSGQAASGSPGASGSSGPSDSARPIGGRRAAR